MMLRSISEERGCAGLEEKVMRSRKTRLRFARRDGRSAPGGEVKRYRIGEEGRAGQMHGRIDEASMAAASVGQRAQREVPFIEAAGNDLRVEPRITSECGDIIRTDMRKGD